MSVELPAIPEVVPVSPPRPPTRKAHSMGPWGIKSVLRKSRPTSKDEAFIREDGSSMSLPNSARNQIKTQKFLENAIVKRNQEYVSDVQFQRSQIVVKSDRIKPSGRCGFDVPDASPAQDGDNAQPISFWQRFVLFCGTCCRTNRQPSGMTSSPSNDHRKRTLYRMLNSRLWKIPLVFFTFLLLFGAQLQVLILPKEADPVMDALFTMALVFFVADMCARIDAEFNYFHLYIFGCVAYSSGIHYDSLSKQSGTAVGDAAGGDATDSMDAAARSAALARRRQQQEAKADLIPTCFGFHRQPFRLGSFLFFCDLVSTLVLLLDISYIARNQFDEETLIITLDAFGLTESVSGSMDVNISSPVQFSSFGLLTIIGKSARIARFIRSSTAVKISSKVNWFLMLNMISPLWWWERWTQRHRQAGAAANGLPTEISAEHGISKSWNTVLLGASVKAADSMTSSSRWCGCVTKALSALGFQSESDREEIRRQMAATKIQRAWRWAHRRDTDSFESRLSDEFMDVAWKGRGVAANPMDRELQKRSFMVRKQSRKKPSGLSGSATLSRGDPSESHKRRSESQVGTAMRELSGQRVAMGIIVALIVTVLFTYTESDYTRQSTMIVLHSQTSNTIFADLALDAARNSSVPDLYSYTFSNGTEQWFNLTGNESADKLRDNEKIKISVMDGNGTSTTGYFSNRDERQEEALVSLLATFFVLLVWFFGVTSFAGPVMILVVDPIERMVRLLGMLMLDPLGYQSTSRYKRFVAEEAEITKNTHWTEEVLKGMETSFLMSTILRIGSLMKVGFGSAGVEIIRSNLQKGQTKNQLMLSSQGSKVSCIFLFSDVRSFTDCTECLQEEVFVFTNKIAAVIHSICHSYGGSANKNIGDAFLLSWLLEDEGDHGEGAFTAKHNQADKALLSVVKICVALHHDEYYVDTMSDAARGALLAKLSSRKGPIVQMGFGLHAGKAVQGAIGSTRKIDATYVSEAVERAEFLESSTKKYGVEMLMSDSFHRLLHPNNRRRCRKIDQIIIGSDEDNSEEGFPVGDIVELLTYDIDIGALWRDGKTKTVAKATRSEAGRESDSDMGSEKGSKREGLRVSNAVRPGATKAGRRRSVTFSKDASDELSDGGFLAPGVNVAQAETAEADSGGPRELVLPTGPAIYNASVWTKDEDMRKMRERYTDGLFFHNFNAGLQSFYAKDWDHAKQCFVTILDRFEDGPSRYFLNQIEKHNGKPPRGFSCYGST